MQFHIKHNHANPAQLVPQLASHCPGVFVSKLETLFPFADKAPPVSGCVGNDSFHSNSRKVSEVWVHMLHSTARLLHLVAAGSKRCYIHTQ